MNPQVIAVDKADLKMRTMPLPLPLPIQLRLTVAASGGYLYIATTDGMIQEVLAVRSGQKPGLKSTEEFKHLAKDVAEQGNQFTFLSQRFGRTILQIQRQAMEMSAIMVMIATKSFGTNCWLFPKRTKTSENSLT